MFYLEEPCYLKYGKKDKVVSTWHDLSFGARVIVNSDSRTKFKIHIPQPKNGSSVTLALRAETTADREAWVNALKACISKDGKLNTAYRTISALSVPSSHRRANEEVSLN
jgi:hypothetical protein